MYPSIQISREELEAGIAGSAIAMHARDFYAAADAAVKYLGPDMLREKVIAEFDALPQAKKDAMKENRDYGRFGSFHLYNKPEVQHALRVVACEAFEDFELGESDINALKDPEVVKKISERFPEITQQRILAIV